MGTAPADAVAVGAEAPAIRHLGHKPWGASAAIAPPQAGHVRDAGDSSVGSIHRYLMIFRAKVTRYVHSTNNAITSSLRSFGITARSVA
jgi:hypothetical protein